MTPTAPRSGGPPPAHGWRLQLPEGLYEVPVPPPPECSSMSHLRGEIAPGAPAFGVATTSDREGRSAAERARQLGAGFMEPPQPVELAVPGSDGAARIDGRIDMEEGLCDDGIERIAIVVAQKGDDFVVVTIRTRPRDDVTAAVDRVLGSFAVVPHG